MLFFQKMQMQAKRIFLSLLILINIYSIIFLYIL